MEAEDYDNMDDRNEEFIEDDDLEPDENEPFAEPECPIAGTDEDNGIECEFENIDGSWWCTTHNTWA